MVQIQGATVIARPVDEVFDFVADERNEPTYNPKMLQAEKLTPGPIGEGTQWEAIVEARGRAFDMMLETTEYVRPSRLGSATAMANADIRGVLTFEPAPGGTRMAWSWELRPRGVAKLLAPLIARAGRRQEEEVWAALKRHLEAGVPKAD